MNVAAKPDIVFYQQYGVPYFGVLSLMAHLKRGGFKTDVVIASMEKDPVGVLKESRPRLVSISVMSPEHRWLIRSSRSIRRALPDTPIIVGGVHAIFYSAEILSETCVDLVCNSEGERVMTEVLRELGKDAPDWASVRGISYRDKEGRICVNERAVLTPFSDDIVEERSVYYRRYPRLAKDAVRSFFSSRGCPYRCSFCYNANINDVFRGKGQYVRRKSVGNFMEELLSEHRNYPMKFVFFYDDLFTFDKKWLGEFLVLYKEKINVPFMCMTRADRMDDETARMLSEAGCRTAGFGVETGDYRIRKDILKKDITDEEIIRCGDLLRKYGIKVQTANMFCLPGESVKDALKTVEINIKAKANCAFSALFLPIPGTALADHCVRQNLLPADYSVKNMPSSFLTSSVLDIPRKKKNVIKNVHCLAYFFVKWPPLFRMFKNIVHLTVLSPIFGFVHLCGSFLRHREERGVSFWAAVAYAWRMKKSFSGGGDK